MRVKGRRKAYGSQNDIVFCYVAHFLLSRVAVPDAYGEISAIQLDLIPPLHDGNCWADSTPEDEHT